ncbi:MAG: hypothetical protein ACO23H_03140 [Alphaproteobacteria bacterium]
MTRSPNYVNPPAVGNTLVDPNAGAGTNQIGAVDVKVAGGSNLYLADAAVPNTLYWFGEQMDDTAIVTREFFNDVPGDSNGGPQGAPIERQTLGRIVQISFSLSTWSQRVRYWLERQNTVYFTNGAVRDWEIGTPILQYHRFRLLIVPSRNNQITAALPSDKSGDFFTFNFPTTLMASPIETGQSSKFSALSFTMEAHRTPPIDDAKRGVIWDRDVSGLSEAVQARQEQQNAAYQEIIDARKAESPIE